MAVELANPLATAEYTKDFQIEIRVLKRFFPRSYKDLIFNKNLLYERGNNGINSIELYTPKEFKFLYGTLKVLYESLDNRINVIAIEPEEILLKCHTYYPEIYMGIPVFSEKDKFKLNLFKKMEENND